MTASACENRAASIDQLVLDLAASIYTPVAPLEIDVWATAEPVPFSERMCGEKSSPRIGDAWGRRLFDCAWMRFRAQWKTEYAEVALVVRLDVNGELCLVDEAGVPTRGLTCIKSTFDPALGGPGKTIYRLPEEVRRAGRLELWADAGCNDLFGFLKDGGRIALAEVAVCREEARQLYYDVETLRDYLLGSPADGPVATRLRTELLAIADTLDCTSDADVTRARERLAAWFSEAGGCMGEPPLRVHAIGHSHLDLAWFWPIRETIRKGARTFASALYNIERYPEYVFGCSQPQLFAWMRAHQPGLYSKIKHAVAGRRIEPLGTFWVEPDCNMPSGESFVRQILSGARFFRDEFGVIPRHCWQPDVFGYHGQLPQILRKSGHEGFMTQKLSWNLVNRFGHHSFHWEGIDGTRILTHMLPEETYNSPAAARSLRKIADEYLERDVSGHALMVFGIGDGGGGPDAEHLERLRRAPRLPGLPTVTQGSAGDFFDAWSRDAHRFPVWRGELYLERHQGTLTTQALAKRNNRRAEVALRELEWAAYLAKQYAGFAYPEEALDRIWKEILLYQFHDILPGSSIKRVYDECNARYVALLGELATLTGERYAALAARIAGANQMITFNSLAWPRREWVRLGRGWHHVEIPAFGWAIIDSPKEAPPDLSAAPHRLENENLRVAFAADGRIAAVFDKRAGREVLSAEAPGNDFVIIPDTGDAWDYEADHAKKDVWGYLRQPESRPCIHEITTEVDGPCATIMQVWRHRDSEIRQHIRLFAGAEMLVFETELDWREPATMLRVRFPVAVNAEEASFEIPFGHLRRSTLEDTSHRRAQFEVAALQWVDLSEAGHGVALYNDCKHGFRVKGRTLDMALLRSVPYPGAALIGREDRAEGDDGRVYSDLGRHVFRYALRPHAGPADAALLTAEARAFNTPLFVFPGAHERALPAAADLWRPPLLIDSPSIELAAVKPAEDGRSWIVRLVNLTADSVAVRVRCDGLAHYALCDLLERPIEAQTEARAEFSAFEIKTLRFSPSV